MSTIKVTNIQDTAGSNSSTSAEIFSGRAKAWVNFNGQGTVSVRSDYNVNTVGDNGTGQYTVNYSTAIGNANYSAVAGGSRNGTTASDNSYHGFYNLASGSIQCCSAGPVNAFTDPVFFALAVFST